MLTLKDLKREFGITPTDVRYDDVLIDYAGQVIALIRQRTSRDICWIADKFEVFGAEMRIRCIQHGFSQGELISIQGTTTQPCIDHQEIVSRVIDENTFAIPWDETTVSLGDDQRARLHPNRMIEFRALNRDRVWIPEQIVPFKILCDVFCRTTMTEWERVDPSEYRLTTNQTTAKSIGIDRLTGCWNVWTEYPRGQFALRRTPAVDTVRVCYWGGSDYVPAELRIAATSLVADMFERQGGGKDISQMSFEGVSVSRLTGAERQTQLLSSQRIIDNWVAR